MSTKRISMLEARIEKIKTELVQVGPMRPGSLSQQFRKPKEKERPFWQLNYAHGGKTKTEYVRPVNLTRVQDEIEQYRRFKKLTDQWISTAITLSQLKQKAVPKEG